MIKTHLIFMLCLLCFSLETFAQSSEKTIKVQAEIDGNAVKSEDIQIEIRVNERILTPQIIRGGFSADVLGWVNENERNIEVQIKCKRYELKLLDLSKDHFQGRWTISITTAPHLDKRDLPNAENVDYTYMVEFMPINGEGIAISNVKYKNLPVAPSAQPSYRTIMILAEIDGKPVNCEKLKVELSVDKKPIFPQITGDELSLSLPDLVDEDKRDVVLKVTYKRYELEFIGLTKNHLKGQWKIVITTAPHLDTSDLPNAENVDYAYRIEFQSGDSLGTVWSSLKYRDSPAVSSLAVKAPKEKRPKPIVWTKPKQEEKNLLGNGKTLSSTQKVTAQNHNDKTVLSCGANADILLLKDKPTIYITFERAGMVKPAPVRLAATDNLQEIADGHSDENSQVVWLRLHNNTRWAINFPTDSLYIGTNITPTRLCNGRPALGLRSGIEVNARYKMEVVDNAAAAQTTESGIAINNPTGILKPPVLNRSDVFSTSWLPAGGSVIFSVPREHLTRQYSIYIPYKYEWEFGEPSVKSDEPQHRVYFHTHNLSENSASKKSISGRQVKVLRFEVDKKEIKSSFKIILYLNDKEIEPVRDGNSFFVPQEVDNSIVTVRFISSGYDLLFHPIYPSKFDADWIIGVDNKPFDTDNVSPEEARNVKMVYYSQFVSREGDDTILVVSVLKKKRPSVEASRESSNWFFSSLGATSPIDGDPKPCPYSSADARPSIYTGKSNNKNYCQ
jgi:hypothetical protein